jgi:peptidoglycan/xylan/chitin deacetylase (PgdA/CDA1 family)
VVAALAACQDSVADLDGAFYDGDGRLVHCGVNLDTSAKNDIASVDSGLDRARDRGEVVELYTHNPGSSVPLSKLEHVLAGAHDRGLAFFTYDDFASGRDAEAGLALSFDDTFIDAWVALLPLLAQYDARVTFFVTRYHNLDDAGRAKIRMLADAGHDIESHTVNHLRGPDYVESYGLAAYLRDEIDPSIDLMRSDGYAIQAFAYPFGARTGELDRAIGKRVKVIRSVSFSYTVVPSPCPR